MTERIERLIGASEAEEWTSEGGWVANRVQAVRRFRIGLDELKAQIDPLRRLLPDRLSQELNAAPPASLDPSDDSLFQSAENCFQGQNPALDALAASDIRSPTIDVQEAALIVSAVRTAPGPRAEKPSAEPAAPAAPTETP